MPTDSLRATDDLGARDAFHPRVTLDSILGKIASTTTFIAADGCDIDDNGVRVPESHKLLTICLVTMANGFTVIGKSAPASAENFDKDKGAAFALEDEIRQIWPLEGYLLREELLRGLPPTGGDA